MRIYLGAIVAVLLVFAMPAGAQWLKYKTPGIPRTADGKPDLNAPTPRTPEGKPDLSGLWQENSGRYGENIASDLKPGEVLPWAEELFKKRDAEYSKDHPVYRCMPPPGFLLGFFGMFRVLQTPGITAILSETSTMYRQIFTDGRSLPEDPDPTWIGYSVGRWEGDTFVVESAGFNDRSWLDLGHSHSEALRVTERFLRKDFGHMEHQITLVDPKVFTKPVTISVNIQLQPDTEMLEDVCNENEKDIQHFVITDADRRRHENALQLPTSVLARYVGSYEQQYGQRKLFDVLLEGNQLVIKTASGAKTPLEAISETKFSGFGGSVTFFADDKGAITHLLIQIVEGDFKSIRK